MILENFCVVQRFILLACPWMLLSIMLTELIATGIDNLARLMCCVEQNSHVHTTMWKQPFPWLH